MSADQSGKAIEIAFVNNMPDQALATTLAQFSRLLAAGAGDAAYRLRCYTLPSVGRSETAMRYLEQTHEDIGALYARGADALIVTGAEPRAFALPDEPYWNDLARLVDWARVNTVSALWSCLASHAAVLRLAGVGRRRAERKISGVYFFEATPGDWVMEGARSRVVVPHSRYNGLQREELECRGFTISSWSPIVGVDVFWRREPSLFLFLQGHPEYDGDTLAKEYRRDVARFLKGELSGYPNAPVGYFDETTVRRLMDFSGRARARADVECEDELHEILDGRRATIDWGEDAARLYRNWIGMVQSQMRALRRSA